MVAGVATALGLAGLLLMQAVAAQTPAPATATAATTTTTATTPSSPPSPPGLRVLAVGQPTWQAIGELAKYLASPAIAAAGLPPVTMELIRHDSRQQMLDDFAALQPRLGDYAAVYVASISAARMIQQRAPAVPIIFEGVDDAVGRCLVDSLQRPGRNASGYMHLLPDNEPRMVQLLHDAFPQLRQVVVLASASNLRMRHCDDQAQPLVMPDCQPGLHDDDGVLQKIMEARPYLEQARRRSLKLRFLVLCGPQDFARMGEFVNADSGVIVPWQNMLDLEDAALTEALARLRRPAISSRTAFAKAGGLMALAVQLPPVQPRESLRQLTQVLQGQSTQTMPVSTPYGMRLTINARAAQAQGLRPTMETWQRADEVLE